MTQEEATKETKEEVKKPTIEDLQSNYKHLASIAGDKQYQVMILKSELDTINQELFKLQQQAKELS